jgi:hypothetical protein
MYVPERFHIRRDSVDVDSALLSAPRQHLPRMYSLSSRDYFLAYVGVSLYTTLSSAACQQQHSAVLVKRMLNS